MHNILYLQFLVNVRFHDFSSRFRGSVVHYFQRLLTLKWIKDILFSFQNRRIYHRKGKGDWHDKSDITGSQKI